jgi:cytidine deaminase
MCLQVLAELAGPELPILLATPDGDHRSLTLGDLLPYRFELP